MLEIKDYELYSRKNILLRIDELRVNEGEFIYIHSSNSTGKSLLLKSLAGIYKNFKGVISIKNQLLDYKDFRGKVRIISEENRLIPSSNVLDNIIFPDEKATEQQKIRIFEMLSEIKSEHLIHVPCEQLSFSEVKFIELIRACIHYPLLLLIDDLDNYFDENRFPHAKNLLNRLNASGTIIISTGKTPSQKIKTYTINNNILEQI